MWRAIGTRQSGAPRLPTADCRGAKTILIDFKKVLYVTSAAFWVLLVATDDAERNSARVMLCGVVGQVRDLFDVGGLLDVFTIYLSRDDALAKLG